MKCRYCGWERRPTPTGYKCDNCGTTWTRKAQEATPGSAGQSAASCGAKEGRSTEVSHGDGQQ
jgi:DNA-directed RNA polymerase subunit RPC12/RpoP